jgi:hypothetical protein
LEDFIHWVDGYSTTEFHCVQKPRNLRLIDFIDLRDELQKHKDRVACPGRI